MIWLAAALLLAHDWYPSECCGGNHCRPVPCEEIIVLPQPDGLIAYQWHGLRFPRWHRETYNPRESPDGACHVCIEGNGATCLFLPKESS